MRHKFVIHYNTITLSSCKDIFLRKWFNLIFYSRNYSSCKNMIKISQKRKKDIIYNNKRNCNKYNNVRKDECGVINTEDNRYNSIYNDRINLYLGNKNINRKNLLTYIKNHKKLLLYTLCKIYEKKQFNKQSNDILNELSHNICEHVEKTKDKLNSRERLIFLSCINDKHYAEKINIIKSNNNNNNNNNKYNIFDEKNVFLYLCKVLKNRKYYLEDNDIVNDILFFFEKKINIMRINNISLYLSNISYLNSKVIIKTNMLYYFVLYMLKYIKYKIKKRMNLNNIYHYVTLLTSCMNISKLKMEKNENIDSYINHLNVIKMTNKNEYSFDSTNFSNISKQNINDKKYLNDIMHSSLIYNDNNFYHYFNIYEHFEYKEESDKKKTINITMPYKRKNNNNNYNDDNDDNNEEKNKNQQQNDKQNDHNNMNIQTFYHINDELIFLIYHMNYILKNIFLKKKYTRKKILEQNILKNMTIPIIIHYMFSSLNFQIFSNALYLELEKLILSICDMNKQSFELLLPPSNMIELLHLMSLHNNLIKFDDKVEKLIIKKFLDQLFIDNCISLNKKDKIILYISISKILFSSKKIYMEKMHNILTNEFINFTYRDLYSIVYALNCSKYCDLPFIESLLRNIYKLKHKYSQNKLLTIISIFYSFQVNMSIFNLLITYANKKDINHIKKEEADTSENYNVNTGAKKLEDDLENKERILKELSSHIKEESNDNFVFNENDILEFNSDENRIKDDTSEEKFLMDDDEIKKYIKRKHKKRKS
ncbi:conserved Plasmodium protein, unknown function [Plasmodium sp. gorilla clade G2]|uniref:conserved Plasmodium protein, unknown function n=1 Tax=Plasmodium sp. gorilla clade G2 TaxID=880535 RepID=UPI000D21BF9A|nr:conserved Plasmodium protein, unknown function [Plasmodium sp. gorilla clade G2]SOV17090.1 conserved Plasmodium protein, unknown function [Plasmodium sp. gorilla clade G2]